MNKQMELCLWLCPRRLSNSSKVLSLIKKKISIFLMQQSKKVSNSVIIFLQILKLVKLTRPRIIKMTPNYFYDA